jgi:hypothetical protein
MSSGQARFPIAPSIYKFSQHGRSGAWVSELLPHTAKMVDDIAIVKSLYTEQINHEPAITFIQTGSMTGGRPVYWIVARVRPREHVRGPSHVRRHERGPFEHSDADSGDVGAHVERRIPYRPSTSGVSLRAGSEPVLFINNPDGVSPAVRRRMLDAVERAQSAATPEHRRSRDADAYCAIRDGVSDAGVGAPS